MALGALLYWRMYRISFRRRSATEGEDAACDDVTLDLGEPQLDLVEPGRVSRREVQVDRGVATQELGDLRGLVRRQVVSDHMDFLGRRLIDDDVGQKATNSAEVWRAVVLPSTSPVLVLNAAYRDNVPWR